MNRSSVLTLGLIAALGAAFVLGASISTGGAKPIEEQKPDPEKSKAASDQAKAPAVVKTNTTRPTVAVFNKSSVMSQFNFAKYQVWLLKKKQIELSKQLVVWRGESIKLQAELKAHPDHPKKDELSDRLRDLTRKIEDEERKINKQLNSEADTIIGDLYDKLQTVVDKTSELNDYHVVFAYLDAVTTDEEKKVSNKEEKLKGQATAPFYVARKADITPVVVRTLNAWYPPMDSATGEPVDVSKLTWPDMNPATPAPSPVFLRFEAIPGLFLNTTSEPPSQFVK